jgi:DNA primase catalytic core
MRRIPDDELQRLKREVPLADLCRDYGIELKPHGADLVGLCPFHDDHEPSFIVTPAKNLWNCLGACGAGGDNLQLVMKKEGVSFRHAVEILQRKLGVVPDAAILKTHVGTQRAILVEPSDELTDAALLAYVVEFYHQTFCNDPKAMQYLQKRGCFHPEAVKTFKLGYANRTLGYRVPEQTVAGKKLRAQLQRVGIYRDSGHEHLSGCVVFPVFDAQGCEPHGPRVAELYGRRLFVQSSLQTSAPKHLYLPGPHAGVWNGQSLAGHREWLLCESLIDALSLWCHGFRQVTASYGVHGFTPDHWALLRELKPDRVTICYDNDDAGNAAANELAQQLAPCGVKVWRLELPPHSDVNDFVRASKTPKDDLAALLAAATRMLPSLAAEPLAAEPTPATKEEKRAAPAPNAPDGAAADAPAFKVVHDGKQAEFVAGERAWRVRGLENNTSFDQLKVNVRVQHRDRFHLDTFDLYNARARSAFIATAEQVTGADKAALDGDLCALVNHLEAHQEQQIFAKLKIEDTTPALSPEAEAEALKILKSPKLLDVVIQDLHRCGLVGEETNLSVAWLVSLSRKLDRPLGVCVMSRSAAGKSSLLEAVAQFVPDEDRHQYTALTPQALFHMPENELTHKALFVAEDVGAEGASYSLKTIQSDGQLVMACTMKDEQTGQMQTKTKIVRGPVAVFLTSTSRSIDDELLNRLLVLTIDEGEEQTRRIHAAQRHAQTLQGILERRARPRLTQLHQNIQRLIRPLTVRNPVADSLRFGSAQLRSRRDNQKYLDLIRTIALAHQYQRDVKSANDLDGQPFHYIEATADDVALADRLMQAVLLDTLDETTPQARRLLALIRELTAHQARADKKRWDAVWWRCRELRERTGWSNRQVRQALEQLVEFEWLEQRGGGMGKLALYRLVDAPGVNLSATFPPPFHPERKGSIVSATASAPAASLAAAAASAAAFPPSRSGTNARVAVAAS